MSRGVAGVCVLVAFVVGAVAAVLLDGGEPARTTTVTVVRGAAAQPARQPRRAPVPRFVRGGVVLQNLVPADAAVQASWRLPPAGRVPAQIVVTWARPRCPESTWPRRTSRATALPTCCPGRTSAAAQATGSIAWSSARRAPLARFLRRETSIDSETAGLRGGALIVERGIPGSEADPRWIHRGYRRWRRTSYRWDGSSLVPTATQVLGLRRHIDPLG